MSNPTAQELKEAAEFERQRAEIWRNWKPGEPRPSDTLGEIIDRHDNRARLLTYAAGLIENRRCFVCDAKLNPDGKCPTDTCNDAWAG